MGTSPSKASSEVFLYRQSRECSLPLDIMRMIAHHCSREVYETLARYWLLTQEDSETRDEYSVARALHYPNAVSREDLTAALRIGESLRQYPLIDFVVERYLRQHERCLREWLLSRSKVMTCLESRSLGRCVEVSCHNLKLTPYSDDDQILLPLAYEPGNVCPHSEKRDVVRQKRELIRRLGSRSPVLAQALVLCGLFQSDRRALEAIRKLPALLFVSAVTLASRENCDSVSCEVCLFLQTLTAGRADEIVATYKELGRDLRGTVEESLRQGRVLLSEMSEEDKLRPRSWRTIVTEHWHRW